MCITGKEQIKDTFNLNMIEVEKFNSTPSQMPLNSDNEL